MLQNPPPKAKTGKMQCGGVINAMDGISLDLSRSSMRDLRDAKTFHLLNEYVMVTNVWTSNYQIIVQYV